MGELRGPKPIYRTKMHILVKYWVQRKEEILKGLVYPEYMLLILTLHVMINHQVLNIKVREYKWEEDSGKHRYRKYKLHGEMQQNN